MTLGTGTYAQSIYCCDCEGKVRLLHARILPWRRQGNIYVEFETVCPHCGRWDTSIRVTEELPESERAFCHREKLEGI